MPGINLIHFNHELLHTLSSSFVSVLSDPYTRGDNVSGQSPRC